MFLSPSPKSAQRLKLEALYAEVATMRETDEVKPESLSKIMNILRSEFPKDWLLKQEIEELMSGVSLSKV